MIIPSLIGFGFSGKATHAGCNSFFVASLWHKLMKELGYNRYGAQGGDIGSGVSTWLALQYPEHVIGLHLNYTAGSYKPYLKEGEKVSDEVLTYLELAKNWLVKEGAYSQLHGTKPITLAYGLNNSPVGLCSWIVEKFNG